MNCSCTWAGETGHTVVKLCAGHQQIVDSHIQQYERDEVSQLAAIKLLRDKLALILPLAKGYAAEHPVGSNGAYVNVAERAMDSTENFVEEVADTDRRFRQR